MARGRRSGFTLIEIMISIAILAIMSAIAVSSIVGFRGAVRDRDYQRALHNAQGQLLRLREMKFANLPPEVVKVGQGGAVRLSQANLVDGSVKVAEVDGGKEVAASQLSLEKGMLSVPASLAGKSLVVDYRFHMGDLGEAHYVGDDATVVLENPPVIGVDSVYLAKGDKLTATSFTLEGDTVRVKGASAGQLVVVDYRGGNTANEVGGRFLDKALLASNRPTDTKMLTVRESYHGPLRVSLSLLKVSP